ncbi:8065_t:CDS:2, partial [Gigaspora margarita]
MLRNLLDKPFRSIKLDRILENVNSQSVLISDPTEVKHRIQQHFQTQYQNRNTINEKVTENWEQIYAPKEEIKDEYSFTRQAAIAYANDTTWVASSKEQMQEIIRIAKDFYTMSHITINGKKTKLLVFNLKFKSQQQTIAIAKELIKAERNEQL